MSVPKSTLLKYQLPKQGSDLHDEMYISSTPKQIFHSTIYLKILQKSVWAECWKEFKFAIDIRAGDTKPVEKEEDSNDGSSSSSSSDSKSEDHYGVIHEDHSKARTYDLEDCYRDLLSGQATRLVSSSKLSFVIF